MPFHAVGRSFRAPGNICIYIYMYTSHVTSSQVTLHVHVCGGRKFTVGHCPTMSSLSSEESRVCMCVRVCIFIQPLQNSFVIIILIEPSLTTSSQIARYIDFFHTSSGWFDCTEPSPTPTSGDTRCAGCTMHRFGEVQAHRTSSNLL